MADFDRQGGAFPAGSRYRDINRDSGNKAWKEPDGWQAVKQMETDGRRKQLDGQMVQEGRGHERNIFKRNCSRAVGR